MVSTSRLQNLQNKIEENTAWLISKPSDIKYFSNFGFLVHAEREAFLLVTRSQAFLFHSTFSPITTKSGITNLEGSHLPKFKQNLVDIIYNNNLNSIFIDPNTLFLSEFRVLRALVELKLQDIPSKIIDQIRAIKDLEEQDLITKACEISKTAFTNLKKRISAGLSELELRMILEEELKNLGSNEVAFPTIVAFGENTALPHHQPTAKILEENMPILIDFGAKFQNYCSDMTRSFWYGDQPDLQYLEIEKIVSNAYQDVIKILSTKRSDLTKSKSSSNKMQANNFTSTAKYLDSIARNFITDNGYANQFVHTTGHGLGLDIHEFPSLNWNNSTEIKEGMIITIEPGIYLNDKFGFRYENTILITQDGCEELTK